MVTAAALSLLILVMVSNVYGGAMVAVVAARRSTLLFDPHFSLKKFYLLMGWAPLAFVVLALLVDARYLLLFVVAGVAGIVGELLVSVLWRSFFREPIWTYSYRSVLSGYTSTLNFLPWAVGALLFHETSRLLGGVGSGAPFVPMAISAVALGIGLLASFALRGYTKARAREFSKPAFFVFCLPIVTTAVALSVFASSKYALLMAAFAVVGFLTEYGYGRSMSTFFERGLWTYNHWQIDEGHTSFVTFPLWALGGLYFHFIAACLGM